MKVNMDFNNFDKMCLNSLWLKLVASYAISQGFTSQMKRIVTHAFLSPFLSLTEQFVVGAGKKSKQNPTESRECNLPAFFYRLSASLHCRNTPCPCPPPPPYPKKKNCLRIVFYLRLREGEKCYSKRFATMIFTASQRCNNFAALFTIVSQLL